MDKETVKAMLASPDGREQFSKLSTPEQRQFVAISKQLEAEEKGAELKKRDSAITAQREHQKLLREQAEQMSPMEAATVAWGKGLMDLKRGSEQIAHEAYDRFGVPGPYTLAAIQARIAQGDETAYADLWEYRRQTEPHEERKAQLQKTIDQEAELFRYAQDKHPVATLAGEIGGQASPFMVPAAAGAAFTSGAGRFATGSYLGFMEGVTPATETGETRGLSAMLGTVLGGTMEALLPIAMPAAVSAFKRLTGKDPVNPNVIADDGNLTPEFEAELQAEGIDPTDFSAGVVDTVARYSDTPEQASRRAMLTEAGVDEPTRFMITQKGGDYADQYLLQRSPKTPEGEAMAQHLAQVQDNIKRTAGDLLSSMDVEIGGVYKPNELTDMNAVRQVIGTDLRTVLELDHETRGRVISSLYDAAEEMQGASVPIGQDDITRTFVDLFYENALEGDQVGNAVLRSLEKYGVVPRSDKKSFIDTQIQLGIPKEEAIRKANEIKPLTVSTAESLLQDIKAKVPREEWGRYKPLIESIESARDEVAQVDGLSAEARDAFLEARRQYRALKRDYSADDIISQIIRYKTLDKETPAIPAVDIYQKIIKRGGKTDIDKLKKLKGVMLKSEGGNEAWNKLRAGVFVEMLSRTIGKDANGNRVISADAFVKEFDGLGENVLKTMFSKEELSKMRAIRGALRLTQATSDVTTPSGEKAIQGITALFNKYLPLAGLSGRAAAEGAEMVVEGASKRQRKMALSSVLDSNVTPKQAQYLASYTPEALDVMSFFSDPKALKASGLRIMTGATQPTATGYGVEQYEESKK